MSRGFYEPLLFLCGLIDQQLQPINQVVELRSRFGLRGQLRVNERQTRL